MKSTRKFLSAALLTLVFATAAFADDGIIHGDSPNPSDGIIHGDAPAPDDGIIHGDAPASASQTGDGADATSSIVAAVLNALGVIIAI